MKFFSTLWSTVCFTIATFVIAGGLGYGPLADRLKPLEKALKHKSAPYAHIAHMVTPQQLAEHRVKFEDGQCTATAVGPHALLTAAHCNEQDKQGVKLDMSLNKRYILSKSVDGRDHVIYIVDGPEFKNYITLEPGAYPAKHTERVYIYGSGDGVYPPIYKSGFQTDKVNDHSEVDEGEGLEFYTIPVVPGDSGSAIFGEDGRIIGVTTYRMGVPLDDNYDTEDEDNILRLDAGFDLNFTAQQLELIAQSKADKVLVATKTTPKPPDFFSLFH